MLWGVLLLYSAIIGIIAVRYRGTRSLSDYLTASQSAGYIQVGSALFTLIGGGEFVTMATLGMLYGLAGVALFVGYAFGFFFIGFYVRRLRDDNVTGEFVSLPDFIYHNHGAFSGLIVFVFSFLAFFALLMLQFSAASTVLAATTPIKYEIWVAIISLSILTYLLIGGLRAVLTTDVLQGACMLLLLPIVIYGAFRGLPTAPKPWFGTETSSVAIIGFLLTGFFVAAASADVWQRAYAAKSDREARIGFYLGGVLFIVYGFGLVLLGIAASQLGVKDPNTAFVEVVTTHLATQPILIVLTMLLVVSAISSTADTELFLLTGMLQRELRRFRVFKPDHFLVTTVNGARVILIVICILSVVAALLFRDLVETYTWLLSALIVISPIVLFSLFVRTSKIGMAFSLIANSILFSILFYIGVITIDNVYLIAIPGFALYALSLAFGRRPDQGDGTRAPRAPITEAQKKANLKSVLQLGGLMLGLGCTGYYVWLHDESFVKAILPSIGAAPPPEMICAIFLFLHGIRFWCGLNFIDSDQSFVAAVAKQYPVGTPAEAKRKQMDFRLQLVALSSVGLLAFSGSGWLWYEYGFAAVLLVHAGVLLFFDYMYWQALFHLDEQRQANIFIFVGDLTVVAFALAMGTFTVVIPLFFQGGADINMYATATLLFLLGSLVAVFAGEIFSQYWAALWARLESLGAPVA
jgi:SSS family solute:Na+ symporter